MNNSQSDRQRTKGHDFWRDEAKLTFLSPFERTKFYLRLPAVVSVGGVAVFIVRIMTLAQDNWLLLLGMVAVLTYPVSLCLELYFKGGEAGARLKDESCARQEKLDDKRSSRQVSSILAALRHDLAKVKDGLRAWPRGGRALELPKLQKDFEDARCQEILQLVEKANRDLAEIDPCISLPADRVAEARGIHQIEDALQHLGSQIDAADRHL